MMLRSAPPPSAAAIHQRRGVPARNRAIRRRRGPGARAVARAPPVARRVDLDEAERKLDRPLVDHGGGGGGGLENHLSRAPTTWPTRSQTGWRCSRKRTPLTRRGQILGGSPSSRRWHVSSRTRLPGTQLTHPKSHALALRALSRERDARGLLDPSPFRHAANPEPHPRLAKPARLVSLSNQLKDGSIRHRQHPMSSHL
jgi:hypothetical protein